MGYYMDLREAVFEIKKGKKIEAMNAIKRAVDEGRIVAWVNGKATESADTFEDALGSCRWEYYTYDDGHGKSTQGLYFDGEKLGSDYNLFCAIAPYVKDGSYIEMQGEDGEIWRWKFKDGNCYEVYPTIVWD